MMQKDETQKSRLLYFTDPMCSWCWGFSPTIDELRREIGERSTLSVVLGGLRPGVTDVLSGAEKQMIREHWQHVVEASGQPFDFAFFDRQTFVYDTEPASRAVVVARRRDPSLAVDFLARLQRAFYAENRDITQSDELVDLAAEFGMQAESFREDFESESTREETQRDFHFSIEFGVRGFPTLIGATPSGIYTTLTRGFRTAEAMIPLVRDWMKDST